MSRGGDDDSDPVIEAFVKFRRHVDAAVAAGFSAFFGSSPTISPASSPTHVVQSPSMDRPFDAISVAFSPYSPAALRHLRQPVPNDEPLSLDPGADGADPVTFTFDDAFEDLLAVSRGRPLPDIYFRMRKRLYLEHMYPDGEAEDLWLRRHISQDQAEPVSGPRAFDRGGQNWEQLHRELDRRAPYVWGYPRDEGHDEDHAEDRKSRGLNMSWLRELTEASKALSDAFSNQAPSTKERDQNEENDSGEELKSLFEFLGRFDSAAAKGQSSFETFAKTITSPESPRTSKPSGETRRVVSKDEHVDWFGYKHSNVTTRVLDKDGNEVGRETKYTLRPAEEPDGTHRYERNATDYQPDVQQAPTKHGWFWK